MTARFQLLEALFDAALVVPAAQRAAWCATQCRGDAALERELLALIAVDERLAGARTANALHIGGPALDAALDRETSGCRIGPYHLREEIGRGGMGRVVRAVRFEGGLEREVAIKFVRRELLDDSTRRRFAQELRALASLDHPGIARLLESGESADGTPCVVMELVRGEPLLAYCGRRDLGVRARVELFRQVLAAVAHAHRNLIVHRDLKPGNVLVDAHDHVKLLDFGLAKPLHPDATETATVERYFTPAYAAPEQLRGTATGVGCDVYALGALLYELLTGAPPFAIAGRTAAEIERLILATPPAPLERAAQSSSGAAWKRQLRGDLDAIVQKALRKEPEHRYLSVEQFDDDVARYLDARPVSATRSTAWYRARRFLARNRIAASVAMLILVVAAVGVGAVVHGARIAAAERDRAQAALAIMRDAFKAADPIQTSGPEVGARDILAAAAERVRGLDAAQPQLFAEIAAEITDAQLALGIYEREGALVPVALESGAARSGSAALHRRLRYLDARRKLGLQDLAGADVALRELESEREDDAAVLTSRAYYWQLKNEPARGIPLIERAIALSDERRDTDQHTTAMLQLAELLSVSGRRDDSLRTFDTLLARQSQDLGTDHPRTLTTRLRRVPVLTVLQRHDEAIREAHIVANALPERFGPDSAFVARANSVLGQALVAAGRDTESWNAFEVAARAYARSLGQLHTTALKARFNYAHVLARTGAPVSRSDVEFDAAIAGATTRDAQDPLTWYFRAHHAKWLIRRGERARAAAVLLPDDLAPDLARLAPANRDEYLGFLRAAFEPVRCETDGASSDERRRRAAVILCTLAQKG